MSEKRNLELGRRRFGALWSEGDLGGADCQQRN
jgi:hypothetical protein